MAVNERIAKSVQALLARGPQVGDTNLHGYTRSTLEKLGIKKDFLKKLEKSQYIRQIHIQQKPKDAKPQDRAPIQAFYCVEVLPEKAIQTHEAAVAVESRAAPEAPKTEEATT